MTHLIFRQKAIDDLSNIWEFTVQIWSENQADKYYRMIKHALSEIADNPDIGRKYTEISEKLLGFKAGKHIIFYHLFSENEIEVIRILHERMDLKNRLID